MPKLFDEFDLDLQKIGGVELYSTQGCTKCNSMMMYIKI